MALKHVIKEYALTEGRGLQSHPGQSFSLSLCGAIFLARADAQMR